MCEIHWPGQAETKPVRQVKTKPVGQVKTKPVGQVKTKLSGKKIKLVGQEEQACQASHNFVLCGGDLSSLMIIRSHQSSAVCDVVPSPF